MYEIKTEDVYKDFSNDKQMFDFSNYSAKSKKYYYDSNRIIVIKTKDETGGVAIKKFVDWKQKIYVLVDDCSEHKKAWINRLKALVNTEMFCWITNVWHIQWTECKVKIIK